MMKTCRKCGVGQDETRFYFTSSKKTTRRATCIDCYKQYHTNNIIRIKAQIKAYREVNRELLSARNRTEKRREQNRRSCRNNRAKINLRERNKRKQDPVWRLRKYIGSKITRALASNGSHKNMSFLKAVPYTMKELKVHLEKQFEPWMTWVNHGPYNRKTWDDNDPTTWKWSLDHIIPQSDLPYTSMTDDNFKKCWALSNLRPLSAKQNLIEGTIRIRHGVV